MSTSLSPRSKAKSKASSKIKNSALDSRQRELLEQQTRLQEQIDELQRVLTDAPRRAIEQKRRVRDEAALPARPQPSFRHSAIPVDKRYADEAPVRRSKSRPMLRAERRAAQRQTLALLVVLAAAIIWALHWLVA